MAELEKILEKHWGFKQFRPEQLPIIKTVMAKKDCLSILPTGGGKSICFQLPTLAMKTRALVISPLVSLMKDQVENLKKKNIAALALHSGMTYTELNWELQNSLKGKYQFIYVSPERLKSKLFLDYLPNLEIGLLVVDEAHCISQWGHDFRPSYLEIHQVRNLLPSCPVAAFTATATEKVQSEIIEKLKLRQPELYIGNFERKNLRYFCKETENKTGYLAKVIKKTAGPSLVFCNTRRSTIEIARFLQSQDISADYYHAGLDFQTRQKKQDLFLQNQTQIMVCTNAFGMGVDKPDVRFVYHLSPPANPESYFQEAGRAGRDLQNAWCILLWQKKDLDLLQEQIENSIPEKYLLERIYNAIFNFLKIPPGGGQYNTYSFDIQELAHTYGLPVSQLYSIVKIFEMLGICTVNEAVYSPSKIVFTASYEEVYEFKIINKKLENLIQLLLRLYGGIFEEYIVISEKYLAQKLKIEIPELKKQLEYLTQRNLADYQAAGDKPTITILEERSPYPTFDLRHLEKIKVNKLVSLQELNNYIHNCKCRAQYWSYYFAKQKIEECGHCDLCTMRRKKALSIAGRNNLDLKIKELIGNKSIYRDHLLSSFPADLQFEMTDVLRKLIDERKVLLDANGHYYWKND